jgi:hypothetical protein
MILMDGEDKEKGKDTGSFRQFKWWSGLAVTG